MTMAFVLESDPRRIRRDVSISFVCVDPLQRRPIGLSLENMHLVRFKAREWTSEIYHRWVEIHPLKSECSSFGGGLVRVVPTMFENDSGRPAGTFDMGPGCNALRVTPCFVDLLITITRVTWFIRYPIIALWRPSQGGLLISVELEEADGEKEQVLNL
jgi:hypothetical protein